MCSTTSIWPIPVEFSVRHSLTYPTHSRVDRSPVLLQTGALTCRRRSASDCDHGSQGIASVSVQGMLKERCEWGHKILQAKARKVWHFVRSAEGNSWDLPLARQGPLLP